MTNYQEGSGPRSTTSSEPYDQSTTQLPPQPVQGGGYQGQYQGQPQYQGPPQQRMSRSHMHVRSTFLTTEFWVLLVVSIGILIASAVSDDEGVGAGFGAHDAWQLITWLAVAYMVSRGLTKLGGNRRDGGERGMQI